VLVANDHHRIDEADPVFLLHLEQRQAHLLRLDLVS
jgi:hypothetical protein